MVLIWAPTITTAKDKNVIKIFKLCMLRGIDVPRELFPTRLTVTNSRRCGYCIRRKPEGQGWRKKWIMFEEILVLRKKDSNGAVRWNTWFMLDIAYEYRGNRLFWIGSLLPIKILILKSDIRSHINLIFNYSQEIGMGLD